MRLPKIGGLKTRVSARKLVNNIKNSESVKLASDIKNEVFLLNKETAKGMAKGILPEFSTKADIKKFGRVVERFAPAGIATAMGGPVAGLAMYVSSPLGTEMLRLLVGVGKQMKKGTGLYDFIGKNPFSLISLHLKGMKDEMAQQAKKIAK